MANRSVHQTEDRLQAELDRFVEFGMLLDRTGRRYLAQYLRAKLAPGAEAPPILEDAYLRYFSGALDRLFDGSDLLKLCLDQPALASQVTADTLFWLRNTYRRMREGHPYEDESSRLSAASVMPLADFCLRSQYLTGFLHRTYRREELDAGFFDHKLEQILARRSFAELPQADRDAAERLLTDLLAQWDALLSARILEFQLRKLEADQESFASLLEAKTREYKRLHQLLSPFSEYVNRHWDLSRDLWRDADFDLLQQYEQLLQDEAAVQELADLLGRMREAEILTEEEEYRRVIVRQEWVEDTLEKLEITGVHASSDLNAMVSSEAGLLADPDTEAVFLKRFADQGLQTFRYEDRRLVTSEDQFTEVHQRVRRKQKGPFIVCVDTSDSMSGDAERIAKVLCFAILRMAASEDRRAFLINFSVGIRTLDLHDIGRSLGSIAEFLRMSFKGGTDISLAMYEVLRQLQTEAYRDADVLVISDFIMYRMEEDIIARVRHFQQNQGVRFHSLTLCDDPNAEVIRQFDTNWVYNPADKGIVRELAEQLRAL
ncbi:MAG: VWA domain-containing protein [Bacteroidia bacterium]|nr:VWA domain-containing protein [Bacteroidia bacterium]